MVLLIVIAIITITIATIVVINAVAKRERLLKLLIPSNNNRIETYGNPQLLPLATSSPNNQIRVVHIGDSHIQAGTLTKTIKELLSAHMGENNQSEGYVFPYNLAGTNSPCTYTFESNAKWTTSKLTQSKTPIDAGIAGIRMETRTPNSTLKVKLTGYAPATSSFNMVRVFFQHSSTSFVPAIADSLLAGTVEKGDNYWDFPLKTPTREVEIALCQTSTSQTHFTLTGLLLENNSSKLIYSAAGLNGASVRTYLLAQNLMPQIKSMNPNVVIVSLGTNDTYTDAFDATTFASNLNKLLQGIRKAAPSSRILLTIPSDHYWMKTSTNPNLTAARAEIIKAAHNNNGCYTWDLYSIMGGAGSMEIWHRQGYAANDLIHFTNKGYRFQGELLFKALTQK